MPGTSEEYWIHQELAPGIRVIRFLRPDLRKQLDPIVGDSNVLFRDISAILDDIGDGERVIFNFGLVERFPTAFFQLMMRVRQQVLARQGQIFLCCFRPEIFPAVELMGGSRLFRLASTEEAAFNEARGKDSARQPM
jgi:anti-anti-sigma regulatory factor